MTSYFRFLGDVREKLTAKYSNIENKREVNSLVSKESAELWKSLNDSDKSKYEQAYRNERAIFDVKIKEWQINENARNKRLVGKPVDVNIESSGSKKTIFKPISNLEVSSEVINENVSSAAASANASDVENEDKQKPKTQSRSKKVPTTVIETEGEQIEKQLVNSDKNKTIPNDSDVEVADVKTKAKAKVSNKAK